MVEKATYAVFKLGAVLVSLCQELHGEMVEERENTMPWWVYDLAGNRSVEDVTRGIGCPSRQSVGGM